MARLTRKAALAAIRGAGATGDQQAFMRLYVENRISLATARAEYAVGARLAKFVAQREEANA